MQPLFQSYTAVKFCALFEAQSSLQPSHPKKRSSPRVAQLFLVQKALQVTFEDRLIVNNANLCSLLSRILASHGNVYVVFCGCGYIVTNLELADSDHSNDENIKEDDRSGTSSGR